MAKLAQKSLNVAFEDCLESLCLSSYPCGTGSWRKDHSFTKDWTLFNANYDDDLPGDGWVVICKEDLEDLLCSPVYKVDNTWHNDAVQLRHKAIAEPGTVSAEFIKANARSLNLNGRKITCISNHMASFGQLERLSLTGNYLSDISGGLLPVNIQELELAGNLLCDINQLTACPLPHLKYLGISYNKITKLPSEVNLVDIWPNIVLIDMCWNEINCIEQLLSAIKCLNSLKSLNMMGNPIALCKLYRACLIHNLPQLTWLDEKTIYSGQKLQSDELATHFKEGDINQTELSIRIGVMENVQQLFDDKLKEQGNQYPQIVRFLQVEYGFEDVATDDSCIWHWSQERKQNDSGDIIFEHDGILNITSPSSAKSMISNGLRVNILCHDVTFGLEALQATDETTTEGDQGKSEDSKGPGKRIKSGKAHTEKATEQGRTSAAPKSHDNKQLKKGKDKRDDVKVYEWSRTTQVVRHTKLELEDFLTGGMEISTTCHFVDIDGMQKNNGDEQQDGKNNPVQKKASQLEDANKQKKTGKPSKTTKSTEKLDAEADEDIPELALFVTVRLNNILCMSSEQNTYK